LVTSGVRGIQITSILTSKVVDHLWARVGWAWQPSAKESSIRGKLFWPFRAGIGIEYDSGKRLKPYLYGSETGNLRSNALEFWADVA